MHPTLHLPEARSMNVTVGVPEALRRTVDSILGVMHA